MKYQECLDFLYLQLPSYQQSGRRAFKENLDNTVALLNVLDHPEHKIKCVHIAGTNGKGTSAHAIAAVLQASDYKVGLYTSPHLKSFRERIKINGHQIDQNSIRNFVKKHKDIITVISPSFFEMTVAMAFDYFASQKVDIAIIETGLGGRLDSTNVIDPEVTLITNIGLDHTDILGDTLEKIAVEKAGIMKKNKPVVIGSFQNRLIDIFEVQAAAKEAILIQLSDQYQITPMAKDQYHISKKDELLLEKITFDIKAKYFIKNIPGILEVLLQLKKKGWKISPNQMVSGLGKITTSTGFKGRFQTLSNAPKVIVDISHNLEGITELLAQVKLLDPKQLHIIYGAAKDRNIDEIFNQFPKEAQYYLTSGKNSRLMDLKSLAQIAEKHSLEKREFLNVNFALTFVKLIADRDDVILITGSTFIIGEIEEL
ncbi:MAG: hypothetical protein CBB92_11555 [Flammeovirgaceae bacterium TMED32]|nr:MAG: hypothetical protein CBB92_11555 [Flammeovirgaceae bacterium TMED32]